jgi:hypothetical protein
VREKLRLLRSEKGTSLIEIAVSMFVLGIVMTTFMTGVSSLQTAAGREESRTSRNDDARLAIAQLDREIRSGNVLYDPAGETDAAGDIVPGMSLRIYTQADAPNRNPGNQCSQWRITGDQLQTRRWANDDPDGTVTEWWTVASNIVNRTTTPTVPAFTLDDSTSYGSRIMQISVVVDRTDDAADPERFDLSITGRNTQYEYPTTICQEIPGY